MTERFSKFVNKCVWVVVIVFCVRCIISGTTIITEFSVYDLYGYGGESIAVSTVFMLLYEKKLWKYNPWESTPVLQKKYTGTFISTHDGVERKANLEIKQTLLSVSVACETGESKSKSITASIDKIQDEWQLTYCYLNVPQANVRDRSAMHYGTAMLSIEKPEELKGQYFSDRKTTGDMNFYPKTGKGDQL